MRLRLSLIEKFALLSAAVIALIGVVLGKGADYYLIFSR